MAKKIITEKRCTKCESVKSFDEFPVDKRMRCGYGSRCRECRAQSIRDWKENNPERYKKAHRRYAYSERRGEIRRAKYAQSPDLRDRRWVDNLRQFGLTPDSYGQILKKQNGVCAICQQKEKRKRLAVDHDHQSSIVRGGLLCASCNTTLGRWRDSPEIAMRAHDYLKRYAQLRLVG